MDVKSFPKSKIGGIFVAVLIIIIMWTVSYSLFSTVSGTSSSQSTKAYVPDEIDLHIQAQQFVLRGLKAPSTAKFPALPYSATTDGNGLYRVISYVDSENSFGAMLRSEWSVTMRLTDNQWTPVKIVVGDSIVYDATSSN